MLNNRSRFRHSKLFLLRFLKNRLELKKDDIRKMVLQNVDFQEPIQEDDDEDYMIDISNMPMPDIPIQLMPLLPPKQRREYQKKFPNLPPYIFMTNKEKKKYFDKKGKQYKQKLSRVPARKSKTKKIVKFKENFDVRPFQQLQKVTKVSETKSIRDNYRAEHFSQP